MPKENSKGGLVANGFDNSLVGKMTVIPENSRQFGKRILPAHLLLLLHHKQERLRCMERFWWYLDPKYDHSRRFAITNTV